MKGSSLRKRYLLLRHNRADLRRMERTLSRDFNVSVRYTDEEFSILRSNQLERYDLCKFIIEKIPELKIERVSGTIRKCKKVADSLRKNSQN
ncbi:MAG: hypothetical protein M1148_01355 [Candidatus Thermoplasmatota archaeon]|nr:hypothetical protein [Candidatus Thermoplasmatota archaeon]